MVLLDRSKLRLKAATAKLKKQRQCNMRREKAQTEPRKGTKGTKENPFSHGAYWVFTKLIGRVLSESWLLCFLCILCLLWLVSVSIVANVKS
jgi:hypothetical protein